MNRLRLIVLSYGTLILKSVNEDLNDAEKEQLQRLQTVIRHILTCILLTATTILLLLQNN